MVLMKDVERGTNDVFVCLKDIFVVRACDDQRCLEPLQQHRALSAGQLRAACSRVSRWCFVRGCVEPKEDGACPSDGCSD